ncbi:MAG: class IV adenylate cyclase [Anaerolineales bacterium]
MSVEIEVKFYVKDIEALKYRLQVLGARPRQARTSEINYRFDTSTGRLTRNKQVLRLRKDNHSRLTYKSPSRDEGGALSRQEIEITVSDFDAAVELLQALGYKVSLIYEKFRTIYSLNQVLICVDELPLGHFIEIEGSSSDDIRAMSHRLGLNWETRLSKSYSALFEHVQKIQSLPFRDMTFANFVGLHISADTLGVSPADTISNYADDGNNDSSPSNDI